MTELSKHLSISEFIHSDTAISKKIDNSLPDDLLKNAKYTAENLFEPIRELLGNKPIEITSGFRCSELNVAVRGVPTSQHCKAQAIDFQPPTGTSIQDAFEKIRNSNLVWDQLICEHDKAGHLWIHASITNGTNRQQVIENLLKK